MHRTSHVHNSFNATNTRWSFLQPSAGIFTLHDVWNFWAPCVVVTVWFGRIFAYFVGIIADNFADEVILEPTEIAKRYLRTFFFLDLISSLPLDYILLSVSPETSVNQLVHAGLICSLLRHVFSARHLQLSVTRVNQSQTFEVRITHVSPQSSSIALSFAG